MSTLLRVGPMFAVGLAVLAMPTRADAQPAPAPGPSAAATGPPTVAAASIARVELAVVGDAPNADALLRHVESWFEGQHTPTTAVHVATIDPSEVFARREMPGLDAWIVLVAPTAARLFFKVQEKVGRAPRYLVSDVPLERGLDELGMEQLAQVVYLSATALWAGNVESSAREVEEGLRGTASAAPAPAAPAPAPPVPPPTPPLPPASADRPPATSQAEPRTSVRVSAEYAARLRGDEGIAQGPSAALSVLWRARRLALGAAARAGLSLPRQVERAGVDIDLHGATFELDFVAARSISDRIGLAAGVGPGIDLVRFDPTPAAGQALRTSAGRLDIRPFVGASIGACIDIGAFTIDVDALLAVQTLRTHYDVMDAGTRSDILVPWQVQPGARLGVSF